MNGRHLTTIRVRSANAVQKQPTVDDLTPEQRKAMEKRLRAHLTEQVHPDDIFVIGRGASIVRIGWIRHDGTRKDITDFVALAFNLRKIQGGIMANVMLLVEMLCGVCAINQFTLADI